MLIGLISDTHDRLPYIDKAIKAINERNVELVLHAGDYIAPFAVLRFKRLNASLIGVFGNNDGDEKLLREKFSEIKAEIRGRFAEIKTGNLKVALLHGDEEDLLNALINAESHDVIVYGHTHQVRVDREERTLIINPGEVCAYLTGKSTIATLDTKTKDVEVITL